MSMRHYEKRISARTEWRYVNAAQRSYGAAMLYCCCHNHGGTRVIERVVTVNMPHNIIGDYYARRYTTGTN